MSHKKREVVPINNRIRRGYSRGVEFIPFIYQRASLFGNRADKVIVGPF